MDVEKGLVDTAGEGGGQTERAALTHIYTPTCQTDDEKLLHIIAQGDQLSAP